MVSLLTFQVAGSAELVVQLQRMYFQVLQILLQKNVQLMCVQLFEASIKNNPTFSMLLSEEKSVAGAAEATSLSPIHVPPWEVTWTLEAVGR